MASTLSREATSRPAVASSSRRQAGSMQQRPRDLDAPRLAAGQRPHFLVGAFGKADLRKRFDRPAVASRRPIPCSAA